MSRYERSKFLDKLIELRAAYATLDPVDTLGVLSIDEVETFASHVFAAVSVTAPEAASATADANVQS